jgi:hypothetical protein
VERSGEGISTCGDGVRRVMSIHQSGPDQSQPTFRVLHQCGTVFNPVSCLAVHKAVDIVPDSVNVGDSKTGSEEAGPGDQQAEQGSQHNVGWVVQPQCDAGDSSQDCENREKWQQSREPGDGDE